MSILWLFANLDNRESVNPYKYVNTKAPDEHPYSTFCIWLLKNHWRADRVMFIADSDFETWESWSSAAEETTDKYWAEFASIYGLEGERWVKE
jgi:hypothetical protein